MKVKLTEIKAATPRVRKELNLDKLDELADSIKETGGVIVPVKLRKNGEGYTTVYGHRRIEACKMAGLTEVEAFIEDMDDAVLLTQALIENVVREDMAAIDIARALKQVGLENEWSSEKVGRKFGMADGTVRDYYRMLQPEISKSVDQSTLGIMHVKEAAAGTDTPEDTARVLVKASKESLSARQTRTVAEEYKRTKEWGGEKAAKSVLDTPFSELGLKQFVPTSIPDRRTRTPIEIKPRDVVFQWVKDSNVIRAGNLLGRIATSIEDLGGIIEYMKVNADKEPGQLKIMKKNMIANIKKRIGELNKLLTKLEEV